MCALVLFAVLPSTNCSAVELYCDTVGEPYHGGKGAIHIQSCIVVAVFCDSQCEFDCLVSAKLASVYQQSVVAYTIIQITLESTHKFSNVSRLAYAEHPCSACRHTEADQNVSYDFLVV